MFGSLTTAYVEALAQRDYRAATRVVAHCVHKVLRCAESVDTRIVAVEAALRAEQPEPQLPLPRLEGARPRRRHPRGRSREVPSLKRPGVSC